MRLSYHSQTNAFVGNMAAEIMKRNSKQVLIRWMSVESHPQIGVGKRVSIPR